MMNTPMPAWASSMPAKALVILVLDRNLTIRAARAPPRIQNASSKPKLVSKAQRPKSSGTNNAAISTMIAVQRSRRSRSAASPLRQATSGPMPASSTAGAISGANTDSKYGGPTEILPRPSASRKSGYSVPSSTAAQATINSTLLASSIDSRESNSNMPPGETLLARQAYSVSEPPITSARKQRMKMPRFGSVANACTEVSTPERTRKVPSRLRENAMIASSTVQDLKAPRFSVTAREWISAVPISQGMKEAFSTGSQNHQPPQPSSYYAQPLPSAMPIVRNI